MIFVNPAFLWGLLAILIPIAVHLLNFHRYRTVYFSNVDRLAELHTESRRSSNMRRWLLLALRILAIVFLVLAFAQPVIPSKDSITRSGSTAVSIYIDNTFSMESASSEGSLLDEAVRKAREIASAHSIGDRYQLLTADLEGSQMQWLSRDEFLEALDEVKSSAASPLMSEVVKRQQSFMASSGAANGFAYLVSDFQRSTADLDQFSCLNSQQSTPNVTLVPLQGASVDNLYIDTVRLDAPAYFIGGSVNVVVSVRNNGSHDAEKVPLKLYIDGHERAMATVDVAAGASAEAMMHFAIDSTGWLDGNVTIEDYPVTFDDNYFFTLRVSDRIEMLELYGSTPNEYLQRLFADDSTVALRTATRLPPTLSDINFIVLNEVDDMPSGEAQQIAAWIADGGTLLIIPKPSLTSWVNGTVRAKAVDYDNSLFRGVFSAKSDEMELPLVHGHYTTINTNHFSINTSQLTHNTIISLSDYTPFLAVAYSGAGRIYSFTAPLRSEYTDFVQQALFVPTLYNMALYSRPLPPASYTLSNAAPIVLTDTYDLNTPPHLVPLNTEHTTLNIIPDIRRVGDRYMLVPHGELTEPGIYIIGVEHIAFNLSRSESIMDFLEPNEVAEAVENMPGYSVIKHASRHLGDELRVRDSGRKLWRLCIILALLALATETTILKLTNNRQLL